MLEFDNVTINVINKNKNYKQKHLTIVDKASGSIQAGKLTAIMGPSGGGKTTLINCLAGRIPPGSITSGSVLVDGEPRNLSEWIHKCAYIDQDDQIFESLTVEETISYAARFRLQNTSENYISSRVEELMRLLSLAEVSKNQMKKLSGGQRKRTMIALELVKDPHVIFLDEPTSGLDTNTANSLVRFLKSLAQQGKIVVFTVHQPSYESFLCFDELILVCKTKIVYNGNPTQLEQELNKMKIYRRETTSLPDFIIEVANSNRDGNEQNILYENAIQKLAKNHEEMFKIKDKKSGASSSSNDYYVQYGLNFNHTILLIKRRFKIESKAPIRLILTSVLLPLAIIFLFIMTVKSLNTKDKNDDPASLTRTRLFFVEFFYLPLALIYAIPASMAFYPESQLIKREIGVATYSTFSYWASIYLYQLTKNLLRNIVPVTYLFIEFGIKHWITVFFLFVAAPVLCIASGLLSGSLTDHKKLAIMVSTIMAFTIMLAFFTALFDTVQDIELIIIDKITLYLIYVAFFLLFLFTPANSFLLAIYIATRKASSGTIWLFRIKLGEISLFVLNAVCLVLFVVLSLMLMGRVVRPPVRMNLSKNT